MMAMRLILRGMLSAVLVMNSIAVLMVWPGAAAFAQTATEASPAPRRPVAAQTTRTRVASAHGATRVYLFLGLGNVFSTGIEVLAEKLKQRNIWATSANHVAAGSLADEAIQAYRANAGPVVLIGHSLGGDATVEVADKLKAAGVPVALLISYGPANSQLVPSNVARAINYYQSNSYWNSTFRPGPGFKGSLRNIDLAKDPVIDHLTIEKDNRLHATAIAAIQALGKGASGPPKAARGDEAATLTGQPTPQQSKAAQRN